MEESKILKIEPPKWGIGLMAVLILFLIIYISVLSRNALKSYDYIGKSQESINVITVSGEGKVTVIPDVATIFLGLQTLKNSVAEAQKENSAKINKLIESLKNLGIKKEDIATSQYNVAPSYDWRDGRQTLKGYQVDQSLLVKIRNFDLISETLGLIGNLNLNQVSNLNFTVDDPEVYRQQARIKALENAKNKAEALAKAVGIKLGKITSFSESGYNPTPGPLFKSYAAGAMDEAASAPAVEPGSQDITMNVSISYEIK